MGHDVCGLLRCREGDETREHLRLLAENRKYLIKLLRDQMGSSEESKYELTRIDLHNCLKNPSENRFQINIFFASR